MKDLILCSFCSIASEKTPLKALFENKKNSKKIQKKIQQKKKRRKKKSVCVFFVF
jgi:hypothetical protein